MKHSIRKIETSTVRNVTPWPPTIPTRFAKALAPFTVYEGGWCRWYAGSMRHICGRRTPLDQIEERWHEKKSAIDRAVAAESILISRAGVKTVRQCAALYYDWLDIRVAKGKPEPLSEVTAADYKRSINGFGRCVGADRSMEDLAQADFTKFAATFDDNAPSTLYRVVASVQAFIRWCLDDGHIAALPQYGRSFVKPSSQTLRDKRLSEQKSYTPGEIRRLWSMASAEEKLWIGLGLNGAFDNSDLAHLSGDVIDRSAGVIDYRRRKTGKVRRVIPLRPEVLAMLDEHAQSGDDGLIFHTPTGLPLQRLNQTASGLSNSIDHVATRWARLMIRAGLRDPFPKRVRSGASPPRKVKAKGSAAGQGFRALRTTFPNLAPPGYRDEIEIIMGHSSGTVLLDSYLERFGIERLMELVDHNWLTVFPCPTTSPADEMPRQWHDAALPIEAGISSGPKLLGDGG